MISFLLIYLLPTLYSLINCQTPTVEIIGRHVARIGSRDIEFRCRTTFSSNTVLKYSNVDRVIWYKSSEKISTTDTLTKRNYANVAIEEKFKNNVTVTTITSDKIVDSILTLTEISCSSKSNYICYMEWFDESNPQVTYSKNVTHNFDVQAVPGKPIFAPATTVVVENSPINFTCFANVGRPRGRFEMVLKTNVWEEPLQTTPSIVHDTRDCGSNESVTASAVFKRAHRYPRILCRAKNSFTTVQSEPLAITIEYLAATVDMRINSREITSNSTRSVTLGSYVVLLCTADSNPPSTYVWSYVSPTDQERVIPGSPELKLMATASDAGTYWCTASSRLTDGQKADVTSPYLTLVMLEPSSTTPSTTVTTQKTSDPKTDAITDPSTNTLAIALGVVFSIVGIALIILIVWCVIKRRSKSADSTKPTNNQGAMYRQSEPPDLYKSHKQPQPSPGSFNTGYNKQDDYLNHIPMSREGRSRNPVMLNEDPYLYGSPNVSSQYSHSRPV